MSTDVNPVGIGILCYGALDEAIRLIDAIKQSTPAVSYHLCVWDNTDTQPTLREALAQRDARKYGNVTVLSEGRNLGCAAARNRLWKHFTQKYPGMKYIAILDQDVLVEPGWLPDMLEVAEAHEDAGQVIWPVFNMACETPLSSGKIHDAASGASLYRVAAIEATGGWDERFFFFRFDSWFTLLSYSRGWPTYMIMKYGKHGEDWSSWVGNHRSNDIVSCGPLQHIHPHQGILRHPRSKEIKEESQALFEQLLAEHGLMDFYKHWPSVDPMMSKVAPKRRCLGVWQFTSGGYSGGRVYLWQYCHAAASAGMDVTLLTNRVPVWAKDFPEVKGGGSLRVLLDNDGRHLNFDVILTDAKGVQGQQAAAWKQAHPSVPMYIMNFETSNWVERFDPIYAKQDSTKREIARMGDYYISLSWSGRKYLIEWLGVPDSDKFHVLPPVVNDHAIAQSAGRKFAYSRPYVVWSGNTQPHKGGATAINIVMRLGLPLDLVIIGQWTHIPMVNTKHRIMLKAGVSEIEKYSIMRGARLVLAPSMFEGYGMLPGEAAALGVPCLAYDLPVLREAYAGWPGLHLVPHGSVARLYEELQRLILTRAPALRPDFRGNTLETMRQRVAQLPHHG